MSTMTASALDLIEARHGIVSSAQLVDAGISRQAVKRLVADGLLVQVIQGAYRMRGVRLTQLGRCVAVCVAHPEAAIAGPTAGRLWGFRRLPDDGRTFVLVPPRAQPTVARWVVPYRTRAIHPRDVVARDDGIVLTSRARTAFDLARYVDDRALLSIVEQAMHDGGLTVGELRAVAVDWLSPRRKWAQRFLEVVDRVLPGGPAESGAEVIVGDALRAAGVRGLVRQYVLDLPGYGRARFDLAVPELRWAIEIDGHPTHRDLLGARNDSARDAAAARAGWTTSRVSPPFTGDALDRSVAELVATEAALRLR